MMFHQYKYTATFWTGIKQHGPIVSISTSCQLHYFTGIYDDSTKIKKLCHANFQHVMILYRWSAAEGHQSFFLFSFFKCFLGTFLFNTMLGYIQDFVFLLFMNIWLWKYILNKRQNERWTWHIYPSPIISLWPVQPQ